MISFEAVEAAAVVLCEQFWDNAHESQRQDARELAREALEAAAPSIIAQALRDAAETFSECEPEGSYSSTPTQVIMWLREHAEAMESAPAKEYNGGAL